MYDWYEPAGIEECPLCGAAFEDGWQGEDGPKRCLVFRQGESAPVAHEIDPEWPLAEELAAAEIASARLPDGESTIRGPCKARHGFDALITVANGVWIDTRVVGPHDSSASTSDRWIAAGKILGRQPRAVVRCPECGEASLEVQDVPFPDGSGLERWMRCPRCRAVNALLRRW